MPENAPWSKKHQAIVRHADGDDNLVNLEITPNLKGDAMLSDRNHTIAAAVEAASKADPNVKVWMRYKRFDPPPSTGGPGRFRGVRLAIREDSL